MEARRRVNRELAQRRMSLVQLLEASFLSALCRAADDDEIWLTWFLFNHFNVHAAKQHVGVFLSSYLSDAISASVRRRFADVLRAVTVHPAMLLYLDNGRNVKGQGNENHARELLELHTLGVGSGYTQRDVIESARGMTGWSVALRGRVDTLGEAGFNAEQHDEGAKQILGLKIASAGKQELLQLLDMLARQPATGRHLSARLCQWWCTDDPPSAMVDRLAEVYVKTEGSLYSLWAELQQIRREMAYEDRGSPRDSTKFKEPLRYVVTGVQLLLGDQVLQQAQPLARWLRLLGQPLFGRSTPDGYPLRGRDWLNSGQLAQRIELAREMVAAVPKLLGTGMPSDVQRLMPFDTERAQALRGRLSTASRATIERANSPAEAWGLLLACPEFMYL